MPGTFTFAQAVSGDTTLGTACNAVLVGGGGTVTVHMAGDAEAVAMTLVDGQVLRVSGTRIVPGTATAVVALW